MMEPCILKSSRQYSCMRHGGQVMGFEDQVDSAERRLEPIRYANGYAARLKNWIW